MKTFLKKLLFYILQMESRLVLWRYKPKIVAITGTVGKTSTKDAVFGVFAKFVHVRKSEKSYNSEIGLPLTILGLPNGWNNPVVWVKNIFKGLWIGIYPHKYPKWLVLEVGVGKVGDMKRTASWLKTDFVIITAIGETPAHIEFFQSKKHLIEEKAGLIKTLKKDGMLILNQDDESVMSMKDKTRNLITTYGFNEGSDVLASEDQILYNDSGEPTGVVFRVDTNGNSLPVEIEGVFGRNHMYASLASLTLISALKWNMIEAIDALKNYDVPPGRLRLLKGINDSLIIDDTYNSSPLACATAVDTLGGIKSKGRKIAVLGDMLELGKHTEEAHFNIGKMVANVAEMLVVVGPRAEGIKAGAIDGGMKVENIFSFNNSKEAGEFMEKEVKAGDLILIKGSQGMRMEKVVAKILLDKRRKSRLLVRQDKEWQNR